MSQYNLIKIIQESTDIQNQISNEIIDFLKTKQKELIPLTQKIMSAQHSLYEKYGDEEDHSKVNDNFNAVYDMVGDGNLIGYGLEASEIASIMDDVN